MRSTTFQRRNRLTDWLVDKRRYVTNALNIHKRPVPARHSHQPSDSPDTRGLTVDGDSTEPK